MKALRSACGLTTSHHARLRFRAGSSLLRVNSTNSTPSSPIETQGPNGLARAIPRIQELIRNDLRGLDEWLPRLDAGLDSLKNDRPPRIAVQGDELSGRRDVVTALLQDPLTDTRASDELLLSRPRSFEAGSTTFMRVTIKGSTFRSNADAKDIRIPSSWLQSLKYDVVEITAPDAETALPDLLTCALTVFVVDPFRLLADPAPFVPLISLNGSAIIVVNGSTPNPVDLQSLRQRLAKQIGATQFPQTLIQVDASRALVANDLLRKALSAEPDASTSIRAANLTSSQSSFQLSQVPALQKAILDSVQACPANAAGRRVFQLSIEAIERTIQNDMSSCFDLERDLTAFRQHIQGVEDRARCLAHDLDPRLDMRGLPEAPLEDKSIQALFTSRWTWLDLIFRARFDELSTRLIGYLRADFGTKEEQIAAFQAGRLREMQDSVSKETDAFVAGLQPNKSGIHPDGLPALNSTVLVNKLSSLSASIPDVDDAGIRRLAGNKRQQLIDEAVPALQSSARRALSITLSMSAIGSLMALNEALSVTRNGLGVAAGSLLIIVGLWLGQRMWIRAQRRFLRESNQVASLLSKDLSTKLHSTVQSQVLVKPLAAIAGCEVQINRRHDRLKQLLAQVQAIGAGATSG